MLLSIGKKSLKSRRLCHLVSILFEIASKVNKPNCFITSLLCQLMDRLSNFTSFFTSIQIHLILTQDYRQLLPRYFNGKEVRQALPP